MTLFGLAETDVTVPVRAITRSDLDLDEAGERFARAALTAIAEPGDGAAGALVSVFGAGWLLTALVESWPAERIRAALLERAVDATVLPMRELSDALARWTPRLRSDLALLALRQAARFGARLLSPDDIEWPGGVDDLGVHAPLALWVRGEPERLAALERSIALVGSRAATGYGEHVAMEASSGLVDRGFAIVSGGAYGIDGMAHRAALASGGVTVAFLAGGLDRFYPSGNEPLLQKVTDTGAVVSEVPCGTPPTRWRFLQRNRLIAAASVATVVLEAGHRSGSLNTAGHAAALGRPLGAVPGPITSSTSAGCHRLIREYDAICVTSPAEMAELAGDGVGDTAGGAGGAGRAPTPSAEEQRVLDALSPRAGREAHDVAARAGLSVPATQAVLGGLELDGQVAAGANGWVRRRG